MTNNAITDCTTEVLYFLAIASKLRFSSDVSKSAKVMFSDDHKS